MTVEALTYTVPEAARLMGVSPTHVWRLIARSEFPEHLILRVGRRTLIPKARLHRWLEGQGDAA